VKVLVTGGAGFIGSNLCFLLKETGYDVLGLDSFDSYYSVETKRSNAVDLEKHGIGTLTLDLAEDGLDEALDSVECVVHLAAQPGITLSVPWESYYRNNILATHRLVEAAKASQTIRRFIYVSSSSCYGRHVADTETSSPKPTSWYGVTKLTAEQEVLSAYRLGDLSSCSVRPFSVFGERERPDKLFPKLIKSVLSDQTFPLFEGSEKHLRSFSYVGDICSGILSCIRNWDKAEGEIFNLGAEQSFTTAEGIQIVEEIVGKKARIELRPSRPGDQTTTNANIDKARSVLGWEPKTTLRDGLERMIERIRREA